MKKNKLDLSNLSVESFDVAGNPGTIGGVGGGTACFETCKTDPTSDPDVDTCGDNCD